MFATRAIITQESLFSPTIVHKRQMVMQVRLFVKVLKIARLTNKLRKVIKRKVYKVSFILFLIVDSRTPPV